MQKFTKWLLTNPITKIPAMVILYPPMVLYFAGRAIIKIIMGKEVDTAQQSIDPVPQHKSQIVRRKLR